MKEAADTMLEKFFDVDDEFDRVKSEMEEAADIMLKELFDVFKNGRKK